MKKIVKAGIAESKTARKKKRTKAAITRSKPFVQQEEKAEVAVSDATGYADCASESSESLPTSCVDTIDPLKEEAEFNASRFSRADNNPAIAELLADDDEDSGMPLWGYLIIGCVVTGLLIWWGLS